MRRILRTLQALALLLGFYAMSLVALALIAAVDVAVTAAALTTGQGQVAAVWGVSLLLAYPLVRGLFMGHPGNRHRPAGIRVDPAQQPRLWQRVSHVAESMEVTPPAEIWLVDEAQAGVWQGSWLLGLVPGRRRMLLGLPLLSGLTVAELDAVIAHELGHYGHGDTLIGGLTARSRAGLQQIVARYGAQEGGFGHGLFAIFHRYARFCLRVSQAGARRQELAADAAAARVAGTETMVRALRKVRVLTRAHERYLDEYVLIGRELELAPPAEQVPPGFRTFLRTAAWQEEAARLESDPPRERRSAYDSHPPLDERIAQLRALPESPGSPGENEEGTADELLEHADTTGGLVVAARPGAAKLRQVGWDELTTAVGNASLDNESAGLRAAARAVLRRSSDLTSLLDAIDAGRWKEISDWMPREGMSRTVTPAAGRSMNAAAAADGLYSLLLRELVAQGRGHWTLDWECGKRLHLDPGLDDALGPALDLAVDEPPTTAPLRALLQPAAAEAADAKTTATAS